MVARKFYDRLMNRFMTLTVLAFCFINSAFGNESEQKGQKIESFLQKAAKTYHIPALSVCVLDNRGITYSFNWGNNDDSPITQDSPFYLGSTSKTFTALAVMRLFEQGKIELDNPVKEYLPDFEIQNKEYKSKITVRHLLNHTSGLSSKGMQDTSMGMDNLDDELNILNTCNPDYAPGIHYAYFNSNYRLLGLLVERVSGISFQNFMSNEVFLPLDMSNTTAGLTTEVIPVSGHGQLFGIPIKRKQAFRKGAVPSGYMISTTNDISKFLIEELKAYKSESSILNKETILKTWQPFDASENSYAMGWLAVRDSIGNKFYVHGGALESYQSFFYLNPDKNIGFVVLMNQGGLLPMMSLNVVRDGLISIINGEQPGYGMGRTPIAIVFVVLLLVVAIYIFRLIRLRRKPRFGGLRKITLCFDFGITLFIVSGFIPLMNWIMGDRADWLMLWNMLPEFCLLLAIICLGNVICGSIKIRNMLK